MQRGHRQSDAYRRSDRSPELAAEDFGHVVTEYRAMRDLFIQDDKLRYCIDQQIQMMGATETAFGSRKHLSSSQAVCRFSAASRWGAANPTRRIIEAGLMTVVLSAAVLAIAASIAYYGWVSYRRHADLRWLEEVTGIEQTSDGVLLEWDKEGSEKPVGFNITVNGKVVAK